MQGLPRWLSDKKYICQAGVRACMLIHFSGVWLCDAMDCSLPGSLCPWDSPGKNTGVDCHALGQGIFLPQESNQHFLHCKQILYHWGNLPIRIYMFNSWVGNIPWRRKCQPTPVFLPGKSYRQGAWQATVHEVAKSPTQLSNWAQTYTICKEDFRYNLE